MSDELKSLLIVVEKLKETDKSLKTMSQDLACTKGELGNVKQNLAKKEEEFKGKIN